MTKQPFVIKAAGGNATAIRILDQGVSREEYERLGKELMAETASLGAEQCGFLILSTNHLEMSGGEFCGNASRAAATLLSKLQGKTELQFTVSGFDGVVDAQVKPLGDNRFFAECRFPGMPLSTKQVTLASGQPATVVDLGGIVHVVVEASLPDDYKAVHRSVVRELGLETKDAVGVVWIERTDRGVLMRPVVWVRAIDTFFYETSCGSGTIAVGKVTGESSIIQPTGEVIEANIEPEAVILKSEMEVVYGSS